MEDKSSYVIMESKVSRQQRDTQELNWSGCLSWTNNNYILGTVLSSRMQGHWQPHALLNSEYLSI